ncbi:MAG: RNA polymerase sigma factor [Caulobacteraceae bacterium]
MTETDECLAARAKAGDRRAFENLVRRHKVRLFRLCRRYVGGADEAYDLVQEAFASAWIGLTRYDERRPFIAWLRAIALNKCRDFGRRRSVRRLFLAAFAREQASLASNPTEPPASATDDRLNRLDHEIARLPTAPKEALLLISLGGLSHQEAAAELGISVKAVEMRVYRAKRRLAARLNVNDGSDGEGE